jgi:hypothetical protein
MVAGNIFISAPVCVLKEAQVDDDNILLTPDRIMCRNETPLEFGALLRMLRFHGRYSKTI